jgi:hypothetical protein
VDQQPLDEDFMTATESSPHAAGFIAPELCTARISAER